MVRMMVKNGMRPVHPGEVLLEDFLKPLGMSANALAKARSWLNLQTAYDLRIAEISNAKRIVREVSPQLPRLRLVLPSSPTRPTSGEPEGKVNLICNLSGDPNEAPHDHPRICALSH